MKKARLLTTTAISLSAALLVYTVVGFLVAPWIIERQLVRLIHQSLGRTAALSQVRVNPYALSVTARGLSLHDKDGSPLAACREIYVNAQLSSLFHRALTLKEARLVAPHVWIHIRPDGSVNVSALFSGSTPQKEKSEQTGSLPRVLARRLSVVDGRLDMTDEHAAAPSAVSIVAIDLQGEEIATFSGPHSGAHRGTFALSFKTSQDEALEAKGTISLQPVHSEGRLRLKGLKAATIAPYLHGALPLELRAGQASFQGNYSFELADSEPHLTLQDGAISVREGRVAPKNSERDLAYIPSLDVSGARLDLAGRRVSLERVSLRSGRIEIHRDAQGRFGWHTLPPAPSADGAGSPAGQRHQGWQVTIDALDLEGCHVAFNDASLAEPAGFSAESVNLHVGEFSTEPGSAFSFAADASFAEGGRVSLKGLAGIQPLRLDAEVTVEALPLEPLRPYLETVSSIELVAGKLAAHAALRYADEPGRPKAALRGEVSVSGLYTRDRSRRERFVEWDSLALQGVSIDLIPHKVTIEKARLTAPFAKILITQDRRLNLAEAFKTGSARRRSGQPPPSSASQGHTIPIEIGTVSVESGSVYFSDFSLTPHVTTGIQALKGTIRGLSSRPSSRAAVEIAGTISPVGSVSVQGELNFLSAVASTDLRVQFQDAELSILSPYSGKFAGYVIKRGKVSLDLSYKLVERTLEGDNKIVLRHLQLGERTNSPDAVKLPIALAVALLKDSNGVIDIDLPVRGSLDDPEFSLKGIILKALKNFVLRIASSPFRALSRLVGGDPDSLSTVSFAPGKAVLDEQERRKIQTLARALLQRPALRLEVCGCYHAEKDGQALREAMLEGLLAERLGAAPDKRSPKKELAAIEALFKERFGKEELRAVSSGFDEKDDRYRAALRARLSAAMVLPEGELRQLGMARAIAVRDEAIRQEGLTDARIFVLEPQEETTLTQEGLVRTRLNLTAG